MKTIKESKKEMITKSLKDIDTIITSINEIKKIIDRQGIKSINFEWNIRTLNSCSIELMELNNYMLNEIRQYNNLLNK